MNASDVKDLELVYTLLDDNIGNDLRAKFARYINDRAVELIAGDWTLQEKWKIAQSSSSIIKDIPREQDKLFFLQAGIEHAKDLIKHDPGFFELYLIVGENSLLINRINERKIHDLWNSGDRFGYRSLEEAVYSRYEEEVIPSFAEAVNTCDTASYETSYLEYYLNLIHINYAEALERKAHFFRRKVGRDVTVKFKLEYGEELTEEMTKKYLESGGDEIVQKLEDAREGAFRAYKLLLKKGIFIHKDNLVRVLNGLGNLLLHGRNREHYLIAENLYNESLKYDPGNAATIEKLAFVREEIERLSFNGK